MAYVPVYRTLLARAAQSAWQHRGLWLFGFFAAFAQTGAVANDVLRLAPRLAPGSFSWRTLEETWNAATFGKTFFTALVTGTPAQIFASVVFAGSLVALLILVALLSQHIVLHGVHRTTRRKRHMSATALRKAVGVQHAGRLFAVDALAKLITVSLILAGSLAIRRLLAEVPDAGALAAIAVYALLLPLAFTVNAVAMHVLVHIVRDDASLPTAFQHSTTFFARHALATLEFTAVLFLANYLATVAMIGAFWLLGQLLVALFAAAITSVALLTAAFVMTALSVLAVIVGIIGFMTTFNYAAWTEFVECFARTAPHPRAEHALRVLRYAFHR